MLKHKKYHQFNMKGHFKTTNTNVITKHLRALLKTELRKYVEIINVIEVTFLGIRIALHCRPRSDVGGCGGYKTHRDILS